MNFSLLKEYNATYKIYMKNTQGRDMKKSNSMLRNNSVARRSRQRQQFIKAVRTRRMARQEVFFLQENSVN